MVKVLSFCGDKIPSVVLGINNIFEYMSDKIDIEFTFKKTDMVKSKDIREADIVICVRGASDLDRDIVKLAKIYNRLIIYYLDDDLLNIPKYSGVSLFYENKQIRENMIYIMETSDILWTSNTNIRKKYGIYFERSYVMDIPINIQEIEKNNSKSDTENKDIVKICFAGSSDHIHMVDKMLSPVINNIAKKYSDQVYFYIIGVKPQKIKESNNVKIVEYFNNIQEYYDFVQKSGIDIGLAPLEASDFTACKYYNKFLDYTCNGMVGIYSDVEPYKLIVKNEFNGMLAKNEEASWEELLEKLILSKKLREKIYFNAVKEVKENFSYEYIMEKVLENIPEIKSEGKYKIKKRNFYLEKKIDLSSNFLIPRIVNGFRIYGMKYLFIGSYKAVYKTLKYLKRKLSYAEEKNKGKIVFIVMVLAFLFWVFIGPTLLSKHFHELDEAYIEKSEKIDLDKNSSLTYSVEKFEQRENSYREIIEISGFAFKEIKQEIKSREILIYLESLNAKNNYIVKAELMQRPEVLAQYLVGEDFTKYMDVGYYAKFSAIAIKNGDYRVNILVKENEEMSLTEARFIIKKDKGIVTILPTE